ncbi:MAG: cell wall hydrolase [Patescibacteria group bacterium]
MIPEYAIIALTLYFEAGTEQHAGRLMVASTIYNQARIRQITPAEACRIGKLYSCWNSIENRNEMQNFYKTATLENDTWYDCIEIALEIEIGHFKPITDATNYYNPRLATHKAWMDQLENRIRVGNHIFGRLPPEKIGKKHK